MEIYHGTDTASATIILGPPLGIDVTLGGGELGRGFYAGSEPYMSASRARGKHKENAAVLAINLAPDYLTLSDKIIKRQEYVLTHWNRLFDTGRTRSYLYGKDVIIAPFATFSIAHQYKFESNRAQDLLNRSTITQMLV